MPTDLSGNKRLRIAVHEYQPIYLPREALDELRAAHQEYGEEMKAWHKNYKLEPGTLIEVKLGDNDFTLCKVVNIRDDGLDLVPHNTSIGQPYAGVHFKSRFNG